MSTREHPIATFGIEIDSRLSLFQSVLHQGKHVMVKSDQIAQNCTFHTFVSARDELGNDGRAKTFVESSRAVDVDC